MTTSHTSPDFERHTRKCSICRHARATGLIRARRENLHSALDNIVEQSDGIRASADAILRAMRAYTCIDAHGRWTDPAPPPRQLIYSNAADRGAASAASFVGRGFRDVSVPDASAGSRDITNAVGDPSTFEATASVAEPTRRDGPTQAPNPMSFRQVAPSSGTPASKTQQINDESAVAFAVAATGRAERTTSEASEPLASPPEADVLPAEAPETDSEVQFNTNRPQADTFEANEVFASPARASGAITAPPSSAAYSSTQAQPATSRPPLEVATMREATAMNGRTITASAARRPWVTGLPAVAVHDSRVLIGPPVIRIRPNPLKTKGRRQSNRHKRRPLEIDQTTAH